MRAKTHLPLSSAKVRLRWLRQFVTLSLIFHLLNLILQSANLMIELIKYLSVIFSPKLILAGFLFVNKDGYDEEKGSYQAKN